MFLRIIFIYLCSIILQPSNSAAELTWHRSTEIPFDIETFYETLKAELDDSIPVSDSNTDSTYYEIEKEKNAITAEEYTHIPSITFHKFRDSDAMDRNFVFCRNILTFNPFQVAVHKDQLRWVYSPLSYFLPVSPSSGPIITPSTTLSSTISPPFDTLYVFRDAVALSSSPTTLDEMYHDTIQIIPSSKQRNTVSLSSTSPEDTTINVRFDFIGVLFALLELICVACIIFAVVKQRERQLDMDTDEVLASEAIIFPLYVRVFKTLSVFCFLQAAVDVLFPETAFVQESPLFNAIIQSSSWAIQRGLYEGVAVLLSCQGVGKRSTRFSGFIAFLWVIFTWLSWIVPSVSRPNDDIFLLGPMIWSSITVVGYFLIWVLPTSIFPRRPAVRSYSAFWFFSHLLLLLAILAINFQFFPNAGICIFLLSSRGLTSFLAPLFVFRAFLSDSRYWMGILDDLVSDEMFEEPDEDLIVLTDGEEQEDEIHGKREDCRYLLNNKDASRSDYVVRKDGRKYGPSYSTTSVESLGPNGKGRKTQDSNNIGYSPIKLSAPDMDAMAGDDREGNESFDDGEFYSEASTGDTFDYKGRKESLSLSSSSSFSLKPKKKIASRSVTPATTITAPLRGMYLVPNSAREVASRMDSFSLGKSTNKLRIVSMAHLRLEKNTCEQTSMNRKHVILGAGSTSRVYKGFYKQRPVAVKMIFCVDLTKEVIRNFYSEAVMLSRLEHPNIVRFEGLCVSPPAICLVMELCKGSLMELLERAYQPLPTIPQPTRAKHVEVIKNKINQSAIEIESVENQPLLKKKMNEKTEKTSLLAGSNVTSSASPIPPVAISKKINYIAVDIKDVDEDISKDTEEDRKYEKNTKNYTKEGDLSLKRKTEKRNEIIRYQPTPTASQTSSMSPSQAQSHDQDQDQKQHQVRLDVTHQSSGITTHGTKYGSVIEEGSGFIPTSPPISNLASASVSSASISISKSAIRALGEKHDSLRDIYVSTETGERVTMASPQASGFFSFTKRFQKSSNSLKGKKDKKDKKTQKKEKEKDKDKDSITTGSSHTTFASSADFSDSEDSFSDDVGYATDTSDLEVTSTPTPISSDILTVSTDQHVDKKNSKTIAKSTSLSLSKASRLRRGIPSRVKLYPTTSLFSTSLSSLVPEPGRGLSWPVKLTIMKDCCRAVAFLHSQDPPVLHLDIKSANFLLGSDGLVKLSDLELSRQFVAPERKRRRIPTMSEEARLSSVKTVNIRRGEVASVASTPDFASPPPKVWENTLENRLTDIKQFYVNSFTSPAPPSFAQTQAEAHGDAYARIAPIKSFSSRLQHEREQKKGYKNQTQPQEQTFSLAGRSTFGTNTSVSSSEIGPIMNAVNTTSPHPEAENYSYSSQPTRPAYIPVRVSTVTATNETPYDTPETTIQRNDDGKAYLHRVRGAFENNSALALFPSFSQTSLGNTEGHSYAKEKRGPRKAQESKSHVTTAEFEKKMSENVKQRIANAIVKAKEVQNRDSKPSTPNTPSILSYIAKNEEEDSKDSFVNIHIGTDPSSPAPTIPISSPSLPSLPPVGTLVGNTFRSIPHATKPRRENKAPNNDDEDDDDDDDDDDGGRVSLAAAKLQKSRMLFGAAQVTTSGTNENGLTFSSTSITDREYPNSQFVSSLPSSLRSFVPVAEIDQTEIPMNDNDNNKHSQNNVSIPHPSSRSPFVYASRSRVAKGSRHPQKWGSIPFSTSASIFPFGADINSPGDNTTQNTPMRPWRVTRTGGYVRSRQDVEGWDAHLGDYSSIETAQPFTHALPLSQANQGVEREKDKEDDNESVAPIHPAIQSSMMGIRVPERINWLAPEIMMGLEYSEKADVYSLTCTLWEVITGKIPYADLEDLIKNTLSLPQGAPKNMDPRTTRSLSHAPGLDKARRKTGPNHLPSTFSPSLNGITDGGPRYQSQHQLQHTTALQSQRIATTTTTLTTEHVHDQHYQYQPQQEPVHSGYGFGTSRMESFDFTSHGHTAPTTSISNKSLPVPIPSSSTLSASSSSTRLSAHERSRSMQQEIDLLSQSTSVYKYINSGSGDLNAHVNPNYTNHPATSVSASSSAGSFTSSSFSFKPSSFEQFDLDIKSRASPAGPASFTGLMPQPASFSNSSLRKVTYDSAYIPQTNHQDTDSIHIKLAVTTSDNGGNSNDFKPTSKEFEPKIKTNADPSELSNLLQAQSTFGKTPVTLSTLFPQADGISQTKSSVMTQDAPISVETIEEVGAISGPFTARGGISIPCSTSSVGSHSGNRSGSRSRSRRQTRISGEDSPSRSRSGSRIGISTGPSGFPRSNSYVKLRSSSSRVSMTGGYDKHGSEQDSEYDNDMRIKKDAENERLDKDKVPDLLTFSSSSLLVTSSTSTSSKAAWGAQPSGVKMAKLRPTPSDDRVLATRSLSSKEIYSTMNEMICQLHHRPMIPPNTPEAVRRIIQAGWHPDPEKRPSAAKMLAMLSQIPINQPYILEADIFS